MCGITGWSFRKNTINPEIRAVLATNLAISNIERGVDSYGIVGIKNNQYSVVRGIGSLADNAHELTGYDTLFAHTRYATNGEVSVKNAHPFRMGKLLGAHNGMIYNHEELNAIYRRNYEVDSQHIFAHLNAGMELEELMGYGSIEWIRRDEPNTIYLARFRGGELAVYGVGDDADNPDGIVWSSSYKHLLKSLISSGITNHFRYGIRTGRVYSVTNGRFFTTDTCLNLTAPPPEPAPDEDTDQPPSHLIGKNSSPGNPMAGRKIDHFRLFKEIYSTNDA